MYATLPLFPAQGVIVVAPHFGPNNRMLAAYGTNPEYTGRLFKKHQAILRREDGALRFMRRYNGTVSFRYSLQARLRITNKAGGIGTLVAAA
jgi:hypothetical protein